jgi:hypothetical protein
MESIKNSNFVNFTNSINIIHRILARLKKHSIRENNLRSKTELQANLRNNIVSIIISLLLQLGKLEPIPRLSVTQIEILRVLYILVKDELYLDKNLEMILKTVVKLLNPSFMPIINEKIVEDQDSNSNLTISISNRQKRIYDFY